MKTKATSSFLKLLLPICWLLAPGAFAGVLSTYSSTNGVGTNDLLLVDSLTNTSPNKYQVHTITPGSFIGSPLIQQNRHFLQLNSDSTNGITYTGTVSGTNGSNFFVYNGTLANFTNVQIGDSIIIGAAQFTVAAATNANQTWGVIVALQATFSTSAFQWYPAPIALNDSIPRRTGSLGGGPGYAVANFSIGNNGGVPGGYYFLDGLHSASIVNTAGSGGNPDYLSFSTGLGINGGRGGAQFQIQHGAQFGDLVIIAANDSIGIRGPITNIFNTNIVLQNSIAAPSAWLPSIATFVNTSNAIAVTGATGAGCTNGNDFIKITTGFSAIAVGDTINIGVNYYFVVGGTNGNSTLCVQPAIQNTVAASGYTNFPCSDTLANISGLRLSGNDGNGRYWTTGPNTGNTAGGLFIYDGPTTATIQMRTFGTDYLSIGMADQENNQYGNQFNMVLGSKQNSLSILANSLVSPSFGLSNINAGSPIAIYGGESLAGGETMTGDLTNSSGNLVVNTAGKGVVLKGGANALCGTNRLVSGSVFVANTSVTASSIIHATPYMPPGSVLPASFGFIVVSNSPGVGFGAISSYGSDTNQFVWTINLIQ